MHIRDEKELLRTRISERTKRYLPKDRDAESRSISRRIIENLPEGEHLTICAYYPMPSEADIRYAIDDLLTLGHHIFLPRFTRSFFEFRRMLSFDDLATGKFGLKEPLPSADLLDIKAVDLALIPAIGFDRQGNRLGRGNGGYDQWIAELRKVNTTARLWGIALEHQLTDRVPTEPHDQTIDALITAREIIGIME